MSVTSFTCASCNTIYSGEYSECPNCTSSATLEAEAKRRELDEAAAHKLQEELEEAAEAKRLEAEQTLKEFGLGENDADDLSGDLTPGVEEKFNVKKWGIGCLVVLGLFALLLGAFGYSRYQAYRRNKVTIVTMQVSGFTSKGVLSYEIEQDGKIVPMESVRPNEGKNFRWPTLTVESGAEIMNLSQTAYYYVNLTFNGKQYENVPIRQNLWEELTFGDSVKVKLNALNEIVEVLP